jgi:hypothetical protein
MKKLLLLLMVSGLVSSAQAALSLSLSTTTVIFDNTVILSVSSDNSDPWSGYLVLSEDPANWTDPIAAQYDPPMVVHAAGDLGYAAPVSGYPAVYYLQAAGTTVLPQPGIQFSIGIQGVQAGVFYIALQDSSTFENLVPPLVLGWPEPATICLLGLGVLFLRRRK